MILAKKKITAYLKAELTSGSIGVNCLWSNLNRRDVCKTFRMALWRNWLRAGLITLRSQVRILAVTGRAHCIVLFALSLGRLSTLWDWWKVRFALRLLLLAVEHFGGPSWSFFTIFPMCSRTSCAQVHEQSGELRLLSGFWLCQHAAFLKAELTSGSIGVNCLW